MPPDSSPRSAPIAVAALLFNALIWGLSWLPFRTLHDLGMHSLWSTTWIYVISSTLILVRYPSSLGTLLRSRWLMLLALAAGLTNACFNWGVTVGDVLRVVLLFYLMPVWALLMARWLLGEPITAGAIFRIGLAACGAATVLYSPQSGLPLPASLGDWLGLGGGVGFALTNVLLRRQADDASAARSLALFCGPVMIAGLTALALSASGPQAIVPWPVISAQIALFASITAGFFMCANLALQYGAARLPSHVTAVIIISEVVFAAVSSWLLGDEVPGTRTLIGGAMIITASGLAALSSTDSHKAG